MKKSIICILLSALLLITLAPTALAAGKNITGQNEKIALSGTAGDENKDGYNDNDFTKIQTFLNYVSGSKSNGQRLNAAYDQNDPKTWTGVVWSKETERRIISIGEKLEWEDKGLEGSLDVSGMSYLEYLNFSSNNINSVNLHGLDSLDLLRFYHNSISSLDLSGCPSLEYLQCSYNKITAIDLRNNPKTREAACDSNCLTSFYIAGLSKLDDIDCSDNSLTSLDTTGCDMLSSIHIINNKLTSFSIDHCFDYIDCTGNQLKQINLYNGTAWIKILAAGPGNVSIYGSDPYVVLATASSSTFFGWTKDGTTVSTSSKLEIKEGGTYTANFGYKVSFDSQGNGVTDMNVIGGTAIPAPASPSKEGYNFGGWCPDAACSSPVSFPYTINGDTVFYAKWTAQPTTNYLKGVTLSAGRLTKKFSGTLTKYNIALGENDGSLTLTPIKEYDGAAMTINKKSVASLTLPVANGKSAKFTVKVSYGGKSKTYTFTATRAKSTDNSLKALSASSGTFDSPLTPGKLNYTLTLAGGTKKVKIYDTPAPHASASFKSKRVTLKNGGTKTIKIVVKAQSGSKKTYVITVVRPASA